MSSFIGQTSGMAAGTLASRVTGVFRDIALVAAIGTGIFSDTYSVANSIPNIIYILIAGGAINAVFIPALVRHMEDDADQGKQFTDQLLTLVGIILLGIVIITVLIAGLIVHLYATKLWTPEEFDVATMFARWCLPQIFFYGLYTLASQILNSRNSFSLPMYAPIINNIIVIATAAVFVSLMSSVPTADSVTLGQVNLLGFGTTLGVMAQALILIPALKKSGYSFKPNFQFRNVGNGKVGNLAKWTIGFVLVNQITFLMVSNLTTLANVLVSGDPNTVAVGFTSYQKGQLMMMLPHSIITVSIITALLPRLSRQAHEKDLSAFGGELSASLRLVAALIIPSAVFLLAAGPWIGSLLYGYGASSTAQGAALGGVASMFALGLPAFSLFYVLLRSYYAQENTKTPFMINLGFNGLHIIIGFTLFSLMPQGLQVAGLALGYSISYVITCGLTWLRVGRRVPEIRNSGHLRLIVRVTAASIFAAFVSYVLVRFTITNQSELSALRVGLAIGLFTISFSLIYLGLAKVLRISEVAAVLALVRRK
ncbi:MAG: murein biosynthesis integral membrane protein MurJ [Candidatus Nanopelagicales bacterium]|nr:murein biosynthesis integral membrane protein MurJ [Candidatus Nanopelagicales bacterium]